MTGRLLFTISLVTTTRVQGTDDCDFPFTYQGQEYSECTDVDASKPWCYWKICDEYSHDDGSTATGCSGGWKYCDETAPPSPTAGSFGTASGKAGWVADHNHFRRLHGAEDVTWDDDLEKKAQDWADNLNRLDSMFHSDCYKIFPASGENLAWGSGSSCSAATGDGGPKLYGGGYDQHCVVASWYGEYYLWRGSGNFQNVPGVGHFTAMVWKGVDQIGCASAGTYYVCEYGSKYCKSHERLGGSSCWGTTPSHLPNFNQGQCSGGACVQELFNPTVIDGSIMPARTGYVVPIMVTCGAALLLAMGLVTTARRWRVQGGSHRLEQDVDEELNDQN